MKVSVFTTTVLLVFIITTTTCFGLRPSSGGINIEYTNGNSIFVPSEDGQIPKNAVTIIMETRSTIVVKTDTLIHQFTHMQQDAKP
jgi:hypothetical protein